jgi:hypothetical protein
MVLPSPTENGDEIAARISGERAGSQAESEYSTTPSRGRRLTSLSVFALLVTLCVYQLSADISDGLAGMKIVKANHARPINVIGEKRPLHIVGRPGLRTPTRKLQHAAAPLPQHPASKAGVNP